MRLEDFAGNTQLKNLLECSRYFQKLDGEVKKLLPPNLAQYFRVVCIDEQYRLVLFVSGGVAANRLKMLIPAVLPKIQEIDNRIIQVECKVMPPVPETKREKNFSIPQEALQGFYENAQRLAHHPELSRALYDLVRHHQK